MNEVWYVLERPTAKIVMAVNITQNIGYDQLKDSLLYGHDDIDSFNSL